MPLMPYAMEKGPYFSLVEDFVNGSRARAVRMLDQLRQNVPIADLGPLDPPIPGSPYSPADLKAHVNRDWFGMEQQVAATGAVSWTPQAQFDQQAKPYTGFWEHWYGESEKVFRVTVTRALEVALGVPHDAPVPRAKRGARHWHVSLFWNCPHPWYEGWIGWKQRDDTPGGGQVTVLINTPAHRPSAPPDGGRKARGAHHDGELYNSPLRPGPVNAAQYPPYEVDPPAAVGTNGMWLVSQVLHQEWTPTVTSNTAPPGAWRPPTLGRPFHSVGEVVTVAIAEADGGVLPDGRPYQPVP